MATGERSGVGRSDRVSSTRWVGTWASGQQLTERDNLPPVPGLSGNTLRQLVRATIGGQRLRLQLSNAHGQGPVMMNSVHVALSAGGGAIDPASDTPVTFGGRASVTIAPGDSVFSDALDFALSPLTNLALSIHFRAAPDTVTGHPGSRTTSYLVAGDQVSATSLPSASTTEHWYYISGIDVLADASAAAVVTLGDSITDGRGSTTNGNDRWPDQLAAGLQAQASTASVAVLNQGIGGNAVLGGGIGPTALERFEVDVLQQRGIRWLVILEGVNDIGMSRDPSVAAGLIAAYEQFIERAHARAVQVFGVPILPLGGSQYDSAPIEATRQKVNDWIRTSGRFDAVLDLDAAVRDPNDPTRLRSAYDTGDHLHLSPAGYRRMAEFIDLALFAR